MEFFKLLMFVTSIVLATAWKAYDDYYYDLSSEETQNENITLDVKLGTQITLQCTGGIYFWRHNGLNYWYYRKTSAKPVIKWLDNGLIIEINSKTDGGLWQCYGLDQIMHRNVFLNVQKEITTTTTTTTKYTSQANQYNHLSIHRPSIIIRSNKSTQIIQTTTPMSNNKIVEKNAEKAGFWIWKRIRHSITNPFLKVKSEASINNLSITILPLCLINIVIYFVFVY